MQSKNIPLYTDISGNQIGIKAYEYGKGARGIYIQGGIHGGEVTYFIFQKLHELLSKSEPRLKKRVLLVPIVNPAAWNQRVYYYTVGKFDLYKGADWNRSYPGTETTMSARNSEKVFSIAKDYELAIDLHTARTSKPYGIFLDSNVKDLIDVTGLPFNVYKDIKTEQGNKFKGTLNDAMAKIGKKAIAIECGSHDSYEEEAIAEVYAALQRTMDNFGVLPAEEDKQKKTKTHTFNEVNVIYSPTSGFVKYLVQPRQHFSKGEALCEILRSDDITKKKVIKAPYDGFMFELARSHITWTGDELLRVIAKKDLQQY